ncbi:ABC transporter ATP-binding protein [Lysinibacillus contaminans]|nr:ABC transporter ATP-binding protein [Lysinibacillus contaminans]
MKMIQCEQLAKNFGSHKALQNITCAIESEKIVGIIGRNGAGKSTLLHILAGYLQPTRGTCHVFGEKPFNNIQTAANTIMIDDRLSFSNYLTLEEILGMGADFYPNWQGELAFRLLDYARLAKKAKHEQLSKGQLATFNLIYGLASRCALTILDEPMNGMDEAIRNDFYRAILKEYIAFPRTILIASHHLQEMESILEEILLINEGVVIAHAPIDELKQQLISLTGPSHALAPILADSIIYTKKEIAGMTTVVVEASKLFIQEDVLQKKGITTAHLSTSDVCMYLTSSEGSDIDAVFD